MRGLYFGETKIVSDSFSFLQQYDKNNKVRYGTEEQKTLITSIKRFTTAYQSRGDFHRSKLNGFVRPFEF